MMTGPCVSRCESLTALPRASGRAKSGACAPSLRAFSAAPEFMSCPIGLSKSCSRFVGNQLAPSAINSSICCCNGVFVGTVITMIVLLAIGMGLAACSFTHCIGSKRSRREPFVTERSSLARAVNETPGLLVGCSYNRSLSHFHCLLNRLELNLDGGRVHFGLHPGVGRILLINMEMSTKRVEASSRRADRQDSDSKRQL